MGGMQDHICSSKCMFCRVLDNPHRARVASGKTAFDNKILEGVQELEQRSTLAAGQVPIASAKGDEIEKLALLDPLTELYNCRTFIKELKDEIKRARRYKHPVSLIMLAIDGFQELSGKYGGLTAEAVLKVIASVLRSCLRDIDIAARYTNEDFAVILPETNAAGAALVAERIRQKIGIQAISHNWHNLKVTASIGLSSFPAKAEQHDALIACSIAALKLAAQQGGDRTLSV